MKKQLVLVVVGLVATLVVAGQLARASVAPARTPEDTRPFWSADARDIVFDENGVVRATPAGSGPVQTVTVGEPRGFRTGGDELLVEDEGSITVTSTSGTPIRGFSGTDPSWSPDGGRIAYLDGDNLRVQAATGLDDHIVATGVRPPSWDLVGPAWSPDGTTIVIASDSSLLLVNADGSGSKVLFTGANQSVNPSWSADGSLVAFERNAGLHWEVWTVRPDGSDALELLGSATANFRYPTFSPVSGALAFISDRQHAHGGATQYQFALYDEAIGAARPNKLVDDVHPYSPPAWSPTGAQLAVAAGQECLRWGIYDVRDTAFPASAHRRSNECRFDGPGDDTVEAVGPLDSVARNCEHVRR